ncbi:MAG: Wzz/FepE/Etk N-terminal domain-containing protein [Bacteroidales bacterium]
MENKQPDFNLNGSNLIYMIWQKKFLLVSIGAIAFIASLVVSLLITPQFKSTAILIPSVATQASKDVLVTSRPKGITVFGDDEEVEHLLQILSSETLRREIVKGESLYEHYDIDPEAPNSKYKVNSTFSNRVSFRPSRYRTVRIEVLDEDPYKAASIANSVVVVADSLMRKSKSDVAKVALEVLERQYNQTKNEAKEINERFTKVMNNGVLDLPYQAKEVTREYAQALASGNTGAASRLEKYMKELAQHGAEFTQYINDVQYKSFQLKDMEESLHILRVEAEGAIPSQFIVDRAVASDKKDKPKRSIIIVVSTLSAVFFAIFLLVIVEFFRNSLKPTKRVES